MGFFRVWITGDYNPVNMIEELRSKPAPHWGFYGQFLRAAELPEHPDRLAIRDHVHGVAVLAPLGQPKRGRPTGVC